MVEGLLPPSVAKGYFLCPARSKFNQDTRYQMTCNMAIRYVAC